MIITFCGHSEIVQREALLGRVLQEITLYAEGNEVSFYLGGYGDFDFIALRACKIYKETHPSAKICFITPYLSEKYLNKREYHLKNYDEIIFPEIETVLPQYAILKRNEWMINRADRVIAYVDYGWGGAAKALEYVVKHKKPYVNLGQKKY